MRKRRAHEGSRQPDFMTFENPFSRFRTVDFFGVLVPGFFIIASVGFSWAAALSASAGALLERILKHFAGQPQWYAIAVVVGTAYLLGSVVRAFPVWRLDTPLAKFFGVFVGKSSSKRMRLLYERPYPYPTLLAYDLKQLRSGGCISSANRGPAFGDIHAHIAIDYCKEYAASKSAPAANRIQEVEARTRMFFGMFCAAVVGALISTVFAAWARSALPLIWCGLSFGFALLFGQRLRFVRGHEARMIFYAYLIQRESELRADAAVVAPAPISNPVPSDIRSLGAG